MRIGGLQLLLLLLLHAPAVGLVNPSFESGDGMKPWEPLPHGRPTEGEAQVVQDTSRRGRQSLMLSCAGGREVAVGQVVMLPKASLWQVRGWIRTQGLEEAETDYPSATLQVRTMDGRVVAESAGVGGTSPWREVETTFCVPGDGQFVLALVLDNSGKTDALAWFDDLRFDVPESTRFEQKVLNFPILWNQGRPYTKLLPKNVKGEPGPWICGQVGAAMIARYWSMHTTLRCGGTYWYDNKYTRKRIAVDYNIPFQWDRMASDLRGLPPDDPRVDPVADLVFRYSAGNRTHWPWKPEDAYHYVHTALVPLIKYFGFDGSTMRHIWFRPYVQSGRWNELDDIIRKEIDAGRPVYFNIGSTQGNRHNVVITGYRRIADRYEFTIHWGWGRAYKPAQSFRLDRPIGRYDDTPRHMVVIGLQPDRVHDRLPMHNKVAEAWDSDYDAWPASDMVWNPDRKECAAVFPAGPKAAQRLCFQRISPSGLPVEGSASLSLGGNCRKPALAWSGSVYGLAWEDRAEKTPAIRFARVRPENGQLCEAASIRVGSGAKDAWRPSVTLAWGGSAFGLVYADNGRLEFVKISASGQLVEGSRKTIANGIDPHMVWRGDSYALVYGAGSDVCLARLDADGAVLGKIEKVFAQPGQAAFTPKVTWSGSQFGVVCEHLDGRGAPHVYFCRADGQGRPVAGSHVNVTAFGTPPRFALNPGISHHNGEFVVTFRKGDGYLARLSEQGKILETRYLIWACEYLTHATQGGVTNVLYVKNNPGERSVEIESCLFPLGTQPGGTKQEDRVSHAADSD